MKNKQTIGFFAGILVAVLVAAAPLNGLSREGRLALAFTLMTVVWWAAQVAQSGYVSGVFLLLCCLFKIAEPATIFSAWTGPTIWLIIGAYLIAGAVHSSGLGERISYAFILRFVRGWTSIIVLIFVLTFVLSLLVPHPWPRAFLIMNVMSVVIKASGMPREDAAKVGFAVFAASVPVSAIFLTGDANLNVLACSYITSENVSFIRWLIVMGPPAAVLSLLTLGAVLLLFRPVAAVSIDMKEIRASQAALGKMNEKEIRTAVWVCIAIFLWLTNGITGLDVGWVTFGVALMMSMPLIGRILTPADWGNVPIHVLVFLTAAIAIGKVGGSTGLNTWIASTLFPASLPDNAFLFALFIAAASVVIHMFMGSVIAVMGVAIPSVLAYTSSMGYKDMVVVGIIYLVVVGHYVLPFHNLNILIGQGEENGMYTQREVLKMALPLLAAVFLTVLTQVLWWKTIGLL